MRLQSRARYLVKLFLLVVLLLNNLASSAEHPLAVGIMPYLPTNTLLSIHSPLQRYLEATLGRPVVLYTAKDMEHFYSQAQRGHFDIAMIAPHWGRLLEVEEGWLPIARFAQQIHGTIVVPIRSPIRSPLDLKGARIATMEKHSLASLAGTEWLRRFGLEAGRDYEIVAANSHTTALLMTKNGEADAVYGADAMLKQVPADLRNQMRVVSKTSGWPGPLWLASPHLTPEQRARITTALLGFSLHSPDAKRYFAETAFVDIVPTIPAELQNLDRFLPAARAIRPSKKN
jgi:phosphonate transport system substrate-binding protein